MVIQDIVRQTMGMNAYMDLEDMGDRLLEHGAINGVYLNTEDPEVVTKLREMENVSTVLSSQDMKDMFSEYTGLMSIMIGFLVMLSGVLGFSIVYNATIVSIGERKMEFSSLRVMGFGKEEIFRMIPSENIFDLHCGHSGGASPWVFDDGLQLQSLQLRAVYPLSGANACRCIAVVDLYDPVSPGGPVCHL